MPQRLTIILHTPRDWDGSFDRIDFAGKTDSLADWVADKKPLPAKLDPSLPIKGARKDKKWELRVRQLITVSSFLRGHMV